MRWRSAALCLLISAQPGFGQSSGQTAPGLPRFDVASVRVTTDRPNFREPRVRKSPGRIDFDIVSIGAFFNQAWPDVAPYQIIWPRKFPFQTAYKASATMPKGTTPAQLQQMVQALLSDRFRLQMHWQTKNVPVYLLEISPHGLKIHKSANPPPERSELVINQRDNFWIMNRIVLAPPSEPGGPKERYSAFTMADLVEFFQGQPFRERPMVDRTGLSGYFDFNMRVPCGPEGCLSKTWSDDIFFDYIEKNFGLHVERKLEPTRMLTIDHLEAIPTPN
jgi:uncharacterized protein (TIGR03435 family)